MPNDTPAQPTIADFRLLISSYLVTIDNIGRVARVHIPFAVKLHERDETKFQARLARLNRWLKGADPNGTAGVGISSEMRKIHQFYASSDWEILANSLFVALFSSFDAFVGDLVHMLYALRPDLMGHIERTLTAREVIGARSLDELRGALIRREVDQLRR